MEELFKTLIATMVKEIAAERGVTSSALIGGWLLDVAAVAPERKSLSEMVKSHPRINGKFAPRTEATVTPRTEK